MTGARDNYPHPMGWCLILAALIPPAPTLSTPTKAPVDPYRGNTPIKGQQADVHLVMFRRDVLTELTRYSVLLLTTEVL